MTIAPSFDTSLIKPQTKLNDTDLRFFYGNNVIVRPDHTPSEILEAIDCNFEVITSKVHHTFEDADGNPLMNGPNGPIMIQDNNLRGWFRNDNFKKLATHGNKRTPTNPGAYIEFMQKFTMASDKEISLDLFGTFDHGSTFYMVSKLTEGFDKKALMTEHAGTEFGIQDIVAKEDRTVHYLVLTDYYRDQLAPKAVIFSQELACANGMVRKVTDKEVRLSHDRVNNYGDVAPVLQRAFEESRAYDLSKDRKRHTMLSIENGISAIKNFCSGRKDGEKLAKQLIEIYDPANGKLIGGDLEGRNERYGVSTVWRLESAVTQHATHSRNRKTSGSTLRSQIDGARAALIQQFQASLPELVNV
ncbi:MAG: hypothetical protein CL981_00515 [Euryarchaeota archaeon]|nr:hypothetical protein [Euryarchaeota archaeon]|tara:strand:- start:56 stop:1132 length:1077 start_codon:yes stop_codon:yes gene_type:complete